MQRTTNVMRNHEDGDPFVPVQPLNERIKIVGGNGVERSYGLIKQKQLRCCAERARKQYALLLAAGKRSVGCFGKVCDAKPRKVCRRTRMLCFSIKRSAAKAVCTAGKHHLIYACGKILLQRRLLGQVANFPAGYAGKNDFSAARLHKAQQRLDERGFAAAVFADNAKIIPCVHGEAYARKHHARFVAKDKILTADQNVIFCCVFFQSHFASFKPAPAGGLLSLV